MVKITTLTEINHADR